MKRLIASMLLVMAASAHATSFSTDASDLWWNPSESGWGVNVLQQEDIVFLTFFVYGANGAPIWYSGSETRYSGGLNGTLIFTGPLYQTTGTFLGAPWNPTNVTYHLAGTVTFTLSGINTANVSYTVDGVNVSKDVTRLMWRINDISGRYIGAAVGNASGCAANGLSEESFFVNVTQTPTTATIQLTNSASTCTYTGNYAQLGRMGTIASGTYSCTNGVSGSFQGYEIEASISGFTARATTQNGSCIWQGRFGGVRRN